MKLSAALALFTPTIMAFSPMKEGRSSMTALNSYETAPGATAPLGYWDPLGLTKDKEQELFDKARVGEVKNGRAAMLAVIGYVVPEFYRFPGELAPGLKFSDIPNGIKAINVIPSEVSGIPCVFVFIKISTVDSDSTRPTLSQFWIATFFAIGAVDYTISAPITGYHAPLPIEMDTETAATRESNEVNNGRLAMLAFWELVRHDITMEPGEHLITGLPFLYN